MPAAGAPEGTGRHEGMGMEARLGALERLVEAFAAEVVTRRLVVVDDRGTPRVVAEVSGGTAELKLELADAAGQAAVVLYATRQAPPGEDLGLGPSVGVQLWAEGDALIELDAWPNADGRWHPHFHLSGDT